MDRALNFYSNPTYAGAGFPVFVGSRRRRGGGILGILKSIAMPMLKGVVSKGATQALGLASDVAGDLMAGRDIRSSLKSHGARRAKRLGADVLQSAANSLSKRSASLPPLAKRPRNRFKGKARQTVRRQRNNF